jgi:hypothetical protein
MLPQFFFKLWAGRAMKYTPSQKFGGPLQRWGKASLEEGGPGSNS